MLAGHGIIWVMTNLSMNKTAWAMLILLSVSWGGAFFFVAVAVQDLPPLLVVFARLLVAAAVLRIILLFVGQKMPQQPRLWAMFCIMGFFNNALPFSLIAWGQTQISGGLAAILNTTTPLLTMIVAHFWTDNEKISAIKIFGITVGISGAAFIIGADALSGLGDDVWAQLSILGAACCYAVATVYGLRFRQIGVPPLTVAAGQLMMAAIFLLPLTLVVDRPWTLPLPGINVWAVLVGLGVFCTALSYFLYFRILTVAGSTNLMLSVFLVPVSAIILGALFLDETLSAKHFYGMILISIGLAAIDGRLFKRRRKS